MLRLIRGVGGARLSVLWAQQNNRRTSRTVFSPASNAPMKAIRAAASANWAPPEGWASRAPAAQTPLGLPSFRLGQAGGAAALHPRPLVVLAARPRQQQLRQRGGGGQHSHKQQHPAHPAASGSGGSDSDDYAEQQAPAAAAAVAAAAASNGANGSTQLAGSVELAATSTAHYQAIAAAGAGPGAAGSHSNGSSSSGSNGSSSSSSGHDGDPLSSGDEDGRWHDAMHRALMDSLQPPRSEHPSWWGKRYHSLQKRMAEVLESREAHYLVIGMVLLDLAIVLTELVLSSFYPSPELAPHIVHVAEEALSYTSIGILATFTAELVAKLLVFGFKYFTHSNWHMFDAVIVVISLTLELSLRGVAQEVASLLIFFRLWRIMRIMHGVAEAMELNHAQEMQRLSLRAHQLQTDLSASQQKVAELQQQVALLNVAAAAKGVDLHYILSTAAATQQQLAATAQQQLLAAAAATASKGMELQTILAAAAAQQQQVAATAQQQLLAAAAAAAAAGNSVPLAATAPAVAQVAQQQQHSLDAAEAEAWRQLGEPQAGRDAPGGEDTSSHSSAA